MAEKIFDTNLRISGPSGPLIISGVGTPEGAIVAPEGSIYLRVDGGVDLTFYVKETGVGDTGWVPYSATGGGGAPYTEEGPSRFRYFNDFFSVAADMVGSSQALGTGAANSTQPWQFAGSPVGSGFIRVALGTTASGRAGWYSTSLVTFYLRICATKYRLRGGLMALSDAVTTYTAFLGFTDVLTNPPATGVFFRYTHGVNSGRWQAVCRSAGVETAVDTGVAAVTGGNNTFEIRGATDGLTFTFFINDTLVATITTNLPLITTTLGFGFNFIRSVGTAAFNAASFDYLLVEQENTART